MLPIGRSDSAAVARQELMVEAQLVGRGVTDEAVLRVMREVPRRAFVPGELTAFAADDAALVVGPGVVVPQPHLAARLLESVRLGPSARVLEIGSATGYLAALLSQLAGTVVSIAPDPASAAAVEARLRELGIGNVRVATSAALSEDGDFGAVVMLDVAEETARRELRHLAVGGRLVVAVPAGVAERELVRITRVAPNAYDRELLGRIRFVMLPFGAAEPSPPLLPRYRRIDRRSTASVARLVRVAAESLDSIDHADLAGLLGRIPEDARLVLIGEASHGTSEFYEMRARITRELIARRGFQFVAVEADWPDASQLHRLVTHRPPAAHRATPFERFPTWMWRNREVAQFVTWLRERNGVVHDVALRVGFHGLDLYSLHTSLSTVLAYLDRVDPATARTARERYGCLRPLDLSPAEYGRFAITGRYRSCEQPVVAALTDLLRRRVELAGRDGDEYFDAEQNARLVADAERYYRAMYYGSVESWNLRDRHMFETLDRLLQRYGGESRGVIWAHNSHLGDASATELGQQGEFNLGQLCRAAYGSRAYSIGFGTDRGTVAAASDWDAPMQVMSVRPAHPDSYEAVFRESEVAAFLLPLRNPWSPEVRGELSAARLERAIGVVYRPETELQSHYFGAVLPDQFDEYVWFAESRAVHPLGLPAGGGNSEPFGFDT